MGDTVTEGNYARYGVQVQRNGIIFTFEAEKEDENERPLLCPDETMPDRRASCHSRHTRYP